MPPHFRFEVVLTRYLKGPVCNACNDELIDRVLPISNRAFLSMKFGFDGSA
jgi:hypothetical protein